MRHRLPDDFRRFIVTMHGKAGNDWLRRLPGIISECEQRWSFSVQEAVDGLSYNYVAPAIRSDGTEVILKIGVIVPELLTEIEALRVYDGRGIVQLFDVDYDRGVLMLERLRPGTPLFAVADDEQATRIAAQVMRQLWKPMPPGNLFPTTADWGAGLSRLRHQFNGETGPFPEQLVARAEALFTELLASQSEPVLLHGDLHHWNILAAERQPWLAIDPKGIVGEPAYEVGALLRNPMPHILSMPQPLRVLDRRVDILADELGFDRERILGWGVAQAVLASWWSYEDSGQGWEECLACADYLAQLPV